MDNELLKKKTEETKARIKNMTWVDWMKVMEAATDEELSGMNGAMTIIIDDNAMKEVKDNARHRIGCIIEMYAYRVMEGKA